MDSRHLSDSSDGADDPAPLASGKRACRAVRGAPAQAGKRPRLGRHGGKRPTDQAGGDGPAGRPPSPTLVGGWPSHWPDAAGKRPAPADATDAADTGAAVSVRSSLPATKGKKASYSSAAEKMMASMGFRAGTGLGKTGQGIVEPVSVSTQRGRHGLGLTLPGLEPAMDLEWDASQEVVEVEESYNWIPSYEKDLPDLDTMTGWMTDGPKKRQIDDETEFCDVQVLADVLSCKDVFDKLQSEEMRRARSRSNPFESIKGVFFLNRAAMKMANMDARLGFMFTKPCNADGTPLLGDCDLLYFADVCAGPGGFSEYVLWRRQWLAKGFGFTLRGECDFKLHEFHAGPVETFEPHYGEGGESGDGDVFRRENQQAFRKFVLRQTDGQGVHFMMADGGFSVDGQENLQEILSKQLYLCQFLTAMNIVRTDGHFVCKLFDLFTPFSVGLVYLMYLAFQDICIFKPNTSRPANSERYIVCRRRRPDTDAICQYLDKVNCRLEQLGANSSQDVTLVVPLHVLHADTAFSEYITDSNTELGRRQITGLNKIRTFYRDPSLREDRQQELRRQCLHVWQVPDETRISRPPAGRPETVIGQMSAEAELEAVGAPITCLKQDTLPQLVRSQYDWRAVVMGVDVDNKRDRCLVLGLGRKNVWRRGPGEAQWCRLDSVELPARTLLLAEIVPELRGQLHHPMAQRRSTALHIVDAVLLGGRDVRRQPLPDRLRACAAFAAAVKKSSVVHAMPVRCKRAYRMAEVQPLLDSLQKVPVKGSHHTARLVHVVDSDDKDTSFFVPTGLMLLKSTKDPWMVSFSRTQQREYWFDVRRGESRVEQPAQAVAEFRHTTRSRLCWPWLPDGGCVTGPAAPGGLHRQQFTAHMALPPR